MNIFRLFLVVSLAFFPFGGKVLAADTCRTVVVAGDQVLNPDDLTGAGLTEAVSASLAYLGKIPRSRKFKFCDREYTAADLRATLEEFNLLWQRLGPTPEFYRQLSERFEFLAVRRDPEEAAGILATGYFEPLVEGSLQRRAPFLYPLYRVPDDLVSRDGIVGRLENGKLVPYWTRREIEEGNLLSGLELVFLDDPVEAFILQVQGSGRVRLRDGSIRPVLFGAKNGHPYRSIGRLLVDRGEMSLEQVNLPSIIAYLETHPEQRREIFNHNESFVFFRWGEEGRPGPLGNLGQPLGAGRSVALDQDYYPPGALALLQTRKPVFNEQDEVVGWSPLNRLVLNQDTGSAIQGAGRVDLFLGCGARARITAGLMKTPGRLYLLMGKK
jgi:membrane-bound lytic murein transglycosylase A